MLQPRQQTWIVIDIGSRWIKCARYAIRQGTAKEIGSQKIDIQEEGLLSAEEIGQAIGRLVIEAGADPLAVVLPPGSAVSQVMDLPEFSVGGTSDKFEEEILELIGLSAERCVYDSTPLESFEGYAEPQWITVAEVESLVQRISPLLSQGLRVEAATTIGNALIAAFQHVHPQVEEACLVDIGATQTTLVRLKHGQPIQMTSFVDGGENWTDALLESGVEVFEQMEARLFRDDLFVEPELGPVLWTAVSAWRGRVMQQIEEWLRDTGLAEGDPPGDMPMYLYGGYSAVKGLPGALNEAGGASWQIPEGLSAPVWTPAYGAALMASRISSHKASILPHSLVKMRQRRLNAARLKSAVLYLFIFLAVFLMGAIFKQRAHLDGLATANLQARDTLSEIEVSADLLNERDALAKRIEPIVSGHLNSIQSLETFQRILRVQHEFEFTLIRFSDRRTYFRGMDEQEETNESGEPGWERQSSDRTPREQTQAYVVELMVRGGQAERLQALGDIVGRLRQESYFSNVDRLVGDRFSADSANTQNTANALARQDEAYALLLSLAEAPLSPKRRESKHE